MAKNNSFKRLPAKRSKRFKIPAEPERIDFDARPPIFSLKYMRYGSIACISKCENQDRSTILDTLLRLSQLRWKEIHSIPKEGLGYEAMPPDRFKMPFPSIVTPDVRILVFRYSDAGRIAGFRDKDVYHIVMVGEDLYSH